MSEDSFRSGYLFAHASRQERTSHFRVDSNKNRTVVLPFQSENLPRDIVALYTADGVAYYGVEDRGFVVRVHNVEQDLPHVSDLRAVADCLLTDGFEVACECINEQLMLSPLSGCYAVRPTLAQDFNRIWRNVS